MTSPSYDPVQNHKGLKTGEAVWFPVSSHTKLYGSGKVVEVRSQGIVIEYTQSRVAFARHDVTSRQIQSRTVAFWQGRQDFLLPDEIYRYRRVE